MPKKLAGVDGVLSRGSGVYRPYVDLNNVEPLKHWFKMCISLIKIMWLGWAKLSEITDFLLGNMVTDTFINRKFHMYITGNEYMVKISIHHNDKFWHIWLVKIIVQGQQRANYMLILIHLCSEGLIKLKAIVQGG